MKLVYIFAAILLAASCIEGRKLPNYITAEEFEIARKNPIKVDNTTAPLELPPYEQSQIPHPRPGFGPRLWTNGQVPYTLDPTFSEDQRILVAIAINTYHEATCIRFIPKENQHTSWVDILHDPSVCGVAHVCMNNGAQFAKFGGSCVNPGTMVHELGHTLCMGHEQTRLDRDKWIGFNINVCQPHGIDNDDFNRGLHKLYDYVSIEHYEGECYNGCFQPRQPGVTKCGSGGPLAVLDVEILNELYGCNSGCQGYRYINKDRNPTNMVPAGSEFNGDTLYSCRSYHQGDIIPGKYHNRGERHVAWGGGEHSKRGDDVEVLTNPNGANFQWTAAASLPPNAVKGGRTNEREPIYIIRCGLQQGDQTNWFPGKYTLSEGAFTSYGGQQIQCGAVQFLTCNN